jgi:hypothetical protein
MQRLLLLLDLFHKLLRDALDRVVEVEGALELLELRLAERRVRPELLVLRLRAIYQLVRLRDALLLPLELDLQAADLAL